MDTTVLAAVMADLRTAHPREKELANNAPSLIMRMSDELRCSVCLCTVTDPEQTPCNHLFCKECIVRSLQVASSTDKCPVCKTPVTRRSLTAHETLRETADAFRELKAAFEEETDQSLSQAIPRFPPGGGEWKAEPIANLSQLCPYPQKPAPGGDAASGPSHVPSPENPQRGRRRRGSGRTVAAAPASRRSARRRSGPGAGATANNGGIPPADPADMNIKVGLRLPSMNAKRKRRTRSAGESLDRSPIAGPSVGHMPSATDKDARTSTSVFQSAWLKQDHFDITFPPLPDPMELFGILGALDENVLLSLERLFLDKISCVEQERAAHERRRAVRDRKSLPPSERQESNDGEGQQELEDWQRVAATSSKGKESSSCLQTRACSVAASDNSFESGRDRDKENFAAGARPARQRRKTTGSCFTPRPEPMVCEPASRSARARTRGAGVAAGSATKKLQSRVRAVGENVVATFSMVKKADVPRLKNMLADLGGAYSEDCGPGVTHIVTHIDRNRRSGRTMKTLKGLLYGCWIVGEQWLEKSAEEGKYLDEEDYEATGHMHSHADDAPRRARTSKAQDKPPLFRNQRFLLYGPFVAPSAEDLRTLLELGGGSVDVDSARSWVEQAGPSVLPMHHSRQGSSAPSSSTPAREDAPRGGDGGGRTAGGLMVIVPRNSPADLRRHVRRVFGVRPVADEWVLDSVGAFKRQTKKNYNESRIFDEALFDSRFMSG